MTGDRVHGEGVLWLFCPLTPAGAENQGQLRPCHRAARSTPKDQRVWLGMPGEGTGDKGALGPAEELGCPAMRGHRAHSLLFSFMNVHMSLSSGLCAKEQFPTYWHLRPFWAWMQSCGVGGGQCAESCWTMSPSQLEGEPSGALWSPQPEVRPPPCRTSPPALTSYCCGKLRMDGNGLTDTHFLLALDITRRTRRSLVQLQGRVGGGSWGGPGQSLQLCDLHRGPQAPYLELRRAAPPPPAPHSPVLGLGTAVLEVFVGLHHLPVPPALAAHKLHLQVKGAGPVCPRGTLWAEWQVASQAPGRGPGVHHEGGLRGHQGCPEPWNGPRHHPSLAGCDLPPSARNEAWGGAPDSRRSGPRLASPHRPAPRRRWHFSGHSTWPHTSLPWHMFPLPGMPVLHSSPGLF